MIIDQLEGKYEYDYFKSILFNIDIKENIDFVFMKWDQDIPKTKNPSVLFVTSDEHHKFHEKFTANQDVLLVFRNYLPIKQHPKIKALPLGYLQGFNFQDTDFNDRKYLYSFSGTLPDPPCEATRHYLYKAIDLFSKKYKYDNYVYFYRGWNKGLEIKKYAEIMYNTKIALCPKGYTSSETFRYFEAAKAGCVIISEKKPDVWYYEDSPHIEIDNWSNLEKVLYPLIEDKERLISYHEKTNKWWNEKSSPVAVAKYIIKELNNIGIF